MVATALRKPLGQMLVDRGVIDAEQLGRALEEQRMTHSQKLLGEILIERGMATPTRLSGPTPYACSRAASREARASSSAYVTVSSGVDTAGAAGVAAAQPATS